MNNEVIVVTNSAFVSEYLCIKALTKGLVSAQQQLNFKVCGSENVVLTNRITSKDMSDLLEKKVYSKE